MDKKTRGNAACRKHYKKDPQKHIERHAEWRRNNREHVREYNRTYQAEYRKNNPEKRDAYNARRRAARANDVELRRKEREYDRQRRAADPEKSREEARQSMRKHRLKTKYNLTVEQWEAMFAAQGGVCACCGSTNPRSKTGWATDHCHTTGSVRGILCQPCNKGLGFFFDDPALLRKAISFLKKHSNPRR